MTRLAAAPLLALLAASALAAPERQPRFAEFVRGAPDASAADSRSPSLARPLPFFYDLYSFRGEGGATTVVASFAVRAGRLDSEDVDGEVRYRFNVTLVLADTALGAVARADDSVFVAVPGRLPREHLLHTHVETQAPPSAATVQRVVMIDAPNPGTGQLYTHAFPVPDYGGGELMLSDIALGLPGRGGGWKRGDATLALLPSSHFPGGLFDVYYEVYNLPAGHRYTTEIAFQPVDESGAPDPDGGRTVRVHFFGESTSGPDGALSELRRVDAPLDRGRYRLTVTVRDQETGRQAESSRLLQVRPWREGATLVPACPVAPGLHRPGCQGRSVARDVRR